MPPRLAARLAAGLLPLLVAAATPTSAQIFRAYLALDGNDANPCTLPSPCRLLPAALAAVASGGEVWMLDSGNYNTGPVTVAKSVTILAVPGVLGSVVALGGNAMTVTSGVDVTLRNLNILPFAGTVNASGVVSDDVSQLTVQNCDFSGFSSPNQSALRVQFEAQVAVVDSVFRGNWFGVTLAAGPKARITGGRMLNNYMGVKVLADNASLTTAAVERSVIANNDFGVDAEVSVNSGMLRLLVADSLLESNVSQGIYVRVNAAVLNATARGTVTGSRIAGSNIGLRVSGSGASMVATGNTITDNAVGVQQVGPSALESPGDNVAHRNTENSSGTISPFSKL